VREEVIVFDDGVVGDSSHDLLYFSNKYKTIVSMANLLYQLLAKNTIN